MSQKEELAQINRIYSMESVSQRDQNGRETVKEKRTNRIEKTERVKNV